MEDGAIREEFFSYVNPKESFDYFNTLLNGIDMRTVADAQPFRNCGRESHRGSYDIVNYIGLLACTVVNSLRRTAVLISGGVYFNSSSGLVSVSVQYGELNAVFVVFEQPTLLAISR